MPIPSSDLVTVRDALDAFDKRMSDIGACGDSYCLVTGKAKGMHTNGGCRCWSNKYTAQRAMGAARNFRDAVAVVVLSQSDVGRTTKEDVQGSIATKQEPRPESAPRTETADDRFWLELRAPNCVPERKGPFRIEKTADVLREFMKARPRAMISVVTLGHDGPRFEDAPQCLMMCDGRSWTTARKHIESSNAAKLAAEALSVAVDIIMSNEPSDSRAVSDIAVALASVACGDTSEPVANVIYEFSQSAQLTITPSADHDAGNLRGLPEYFEFMPVSLLPLERANHDPGEHQVIDADTAYIFQIHGSRERAENIVECLNAYHLLRERGLSAPSHQPHAGSQTANELGKLLTASRAIQEWLSNWDLPFQDDDEWSPDLVAFCDAMNDATFEYVRAMKAVAETDANAPGDTGLVSGASSEPPSPRLTDGDQTGGAK